MNDHIYCATEPIGSVVRRISTIPDIDKKIDKIVADGSQGSDRWFGDIVSVLMVLDCVIKEEAQDE